MNNARNLNRSDWRPAMMRLVAVAASAVALTAAGLAQSVPNYNQRSNPWAPKKLGFGSTTIGGYGCALTALAAMECWRGWWQNPETLNNWGKANGGFSGDLVVWGKYPGYRELRDYSTVAANLTWINSQLDAGRLVIVKTYFAPQRTQAHWVLLTGRSGNTYRMMDPWYGDSGTTFNSRYGDPARWIYRCVVYGR